MEHGGGKQKVVSLDLAEKISLGLKCALFAKKIGEVIADVQGKNMSGPWPQDFAEHCFKNLWIGRVVMFWILQRYRQGRFGLVRCAGRWNGGGCPGGWAGGILPCLHESLSLCD